MRAERAGWSFLVALIGCGGVTVAEPPDATTDRQDACDTCADSDARDAACLPFLTETCDAGCADGSTCVKSRASGFPMFAPPDLGCVPIPAQCVATPACQCMGQCACPTTRSVCSDDSDAGGMACIFSALSRRAFKKDIEYVDDDAREGLAAGALSIPLATYRYKTEPEKEKKHLGFIIDDQPEGSPAVQSDRTHVDEYGYASMLLAAVQEQQKQIDALTKKVDALTVTCK